MLLEVLFIMGQDLYLGPSSLSKIKFFEDKNARPASAAVLFCFRVLVVLRLSRRPSKTLLGVHAYNKFPLQIAVEFAF